MKKTSVLSLFLVLAMLLALMAGCGSATAPVAESSAESTAASQEASAPAAEAAPASEDVPAAEASAQEDLPPEEMPPEEAEPVYEKVEVSMPISDSGDTISMYLLLPPFITAMVASPTDLTVLGQLQERSGLTFDITVGNYLDGQTDVNLLCAGGTYPDIINHADLYASGIDAAVNEEIVIDLKDYIVNDMPNLLASLKAYDVDAIKQITTDSGYIAYFPELYMDPYVDNFAISVRKDLMEENGLEIPETYDELHDAPYRLRHAVWPEQGRLRADPAGRLRDQACRRRRRHDRGGW